MRVSVTDIEQFRYYRDAEEMDLQTLLKRLRREEAPSEAMALGSAFHAFLERAVDGEHAKVEIDGYTFSFRGELAVALPSVREVRAIRTMQFDGDSVTVSGIVDAINATTVYDHKLTSQWDAEKYADSYQWRIYLWTLAKSRFVYNVFTRGDLKGSEVEIRACDILPLYSYPQMDADVERLIRDYLHFARSHMPEKFERAAA